MSVIETGGGVKVTCFKYRQCHDNMPDLTYKTHLHITCGVFVFVLGIQMQNFKPVVRSAQFQSFSFSIFWSGHTLITKNSQQFSEWKAVLTELFIWSFCWRRNDLTMNNRGRQTSLAHKQANEQTCGCIILSVHSGFFTCCPLLYKTTDECKNNTRTDFRASLHAEWTSRTLDCDSCFNFSHTSSFSDFNLNAHFTSEN